MEAIGRQNKITLNFLRQAIHELEQAGLDGFVRVPKIPPQAADPVTGAEQPCGQIPLFARSRVSKRTTGILPPLPGRLPLNKPMGIRPPSMRFLESLEKYSNIIDPQTLLSSNMPESDGRATTKRRRVNISPEPPATAMRLGGDGDNLSWCQHVPIEEVSSSADTPIESTKSSSSHQTAQDAAQFNLPHRANSSTRGSSSPSAVATSSSTSLSSGASPGQATNSKEPNGPNCGITMPYQAGSSSSNNNNNTNNTHAFGVQVNATAPGAVAGETNVSMMMDPMFQDYAVQDSAPGFTGVTEAMLDDTSWMMLNDVGVNGGQSWDTGEVGAGVG